MTPNSTLQRVSKERIQEVIKLYQEGFTDSMLRKTLHMTSRTVKKILETYGIKRTRSEQVQFGKGGSVINHNCLDQLTPESLYWIGFLYADGHIERDRPRITLTLADVDMNHLEKFKAFFGTGITVREVTNKIRIAPGQINFDNKAFRVAFSSKKIYERLQELGFTHNKTYGIVIHAFLKNSRDFWRGVVDGDGWLYNKSQKAIGLSGNSNTLSEFINFLNSCGVGTKTVPSKRKDRDFLWMLDLHSNKAQRTADLLYKNATVYLDRKYQKYVVNFVCKQEVC